MYIYKYIYIYRYIDIKLKRAGSHVKLYLDYNDNLWATGGAVPRVNTHFVGLIPRGGGSLPVN